MPSSQTGVSVKVVFNHLPQAATALHAAVVDQVKTSTLDVEARAKQVVAVDTGTLRRSIHSVFENGGLKGICGPSVSYAPFIEFGTRHMAARPYMRPAAALVLPRFADELKRILGGLR
jgi:HK97 gp10 family phage protein